MSKAACVVTRARSYIGMPYRLGEEGPYVEGPEQTAAMDIDCSGLVYAVFRDCGVLFKGRPLWRDTADGYWHLAQRIPGPERVGDMCWFPRLGHKTHVALYIGDDTVIEAGYHGPANTYPGHGYVGTCTVAQMNARGAVWGRLETDIEEDDMTPDEVRKIVREELDIIWAPAEIAAAQNELVKARILSAPRKDSNKGASVGLVMLVAARLAKLMTGK